MKYLNNNIEFDHDKLKFLIKPKSGFMKTAYTTIKGSEVMRVFKKG
ncbi:DDE-type integrase/transposase/recombinase [Candidatus Megaera polyxenophila]